MNTILTNLITIFICLLFGVHFIKNPNKVTSPYFKNSNNDLRNKINFALQIIGIILLLSGIFTIIRLIKSL